MKSLWIVLSWLLAMAVAYWIATRWHRLTSVRRRVLDSGDVIMEEEVPEESGDRLTRWLALAGYRAPGSSGAFLLACLMCATFGAALAFATSHFGLFEMLQERAENMPVAVGELSGPLFSAGPWLVFLTIMLMPWLVVRRRRRERVLAIEQDLPIVLDLFATLSESGLGFDAALSKLLESERDERPLAEELRLFQLETLTGIPRVQCFRRLSDRCRVGSMTIFCSAMVQAEQVGAGFSAVLARQAADLRTRRREEAMVQAHALPVKLVFPLVAFFLPSIFLVTLGPAFRDFMEMIDGVIQGY
jgi:tight adherence protein C